jgi:hypothetical protein
MLRVALLATLLALALLLEVGASDWLEERMK